MLALSLRSDLKVWRAKIRGKPNPLLKIAETYHNDRDGGTSVDTV
jgi:hypothetical protein